LLYCDLPQAKLEAPKPYLTSARPASRLQGVSSRDIKLENTLLQGGEKPLIKVGRGVGGLVVRV